MRYGLIVELHCYDVPIEAALFGGPFATERQIHYLLYYAWGHIDFEGDEGEVDLRIVNGAAMALKRREDRKLYRKERKRGQRVQQGGKHEWVGQEGAAE